MEEAAKKFLEAVQYQLMNSCAYREFSCPGRTFLYGKGPYSETIRKKRGRPLTSLVCQYTEYFRFPGEAFLAKMLPHLTVPAFGRFRVFPYGISVQALPPIDRPPFTLADILQLVEMLAHVGTVADLTWLLPQITDTLPQGTVFLAPLYSVRTQGDRPNPVYLFELTDDRQGLFPKTNWSVTPFNRDLTVQDPRWPIPIAVFTHTCPERMFPTNPVLR